MLFNSFVFLFGFLPIVYVVFWSLRTARSRYIWLTVTGYIFYGWWDARFCLLMLFSTTVSYFAGLGFLRWQDQKHRKLCLVLPVTVDLLLLGFFKYTNFIVENVAGVLHSLGVPAAPPHLNIILPVGISFYTFHTITYIVDSYRGDIKPTRDFFEFTTYVSLFSQLVAGPIVRFRQIEADLTNLGNAQRTRWFGVGVSLFVTGLVEKIVFADTLAHFADPALARYQQLGSLSTWLAVTAAALQLFFDFSGYSSMAMGLGFMFGMRIPTNFNSPFKALDIADVWRRWHMSLSFALRDYLYVPLGGNRHGEWRTYRNLFITMVLCGLWHGANWTFVMFGVMQGILLSLYRRFGKRYWDPIPPLARQIATFGIWVVGLALFRAQNLSMSLHMLKKMFIPTTGVPLTHGAVVFAALGAGIAWSMFLPSPLDLHRDFRWTPRRAVVMAGAFIACLALMLGAPFSPFIYYQF